MGEQGTKSERLKITSERKPSRMWPQDLGMEESILISCGFLCVSLGGMDMKKKMGALILSFALLGMGCVFADEPSTTPEVDPAATQMTEAYPSPDAILPPAPVPPEKGLQDVAAFQKYAEEVDQYVKACQHYIDGATNDANAIINARNEAVKKAQAAVDAYNSFFDKK